MTSTDPRNWAALGRAVRERRQELKLGSQKHVADQAGVSLNTWGRLEGGTAVNMETVAQAARALQWDESIPLEILASRDATARPTTVEAKAHIPKEGVRELNERLWKWAIGPVGGGLVMTTQLEAPSEIMTPRGRGYIFAVAPLPDDVMDELDKDDVETLAETLRQHGVQMACDIVAAKRRALATQEARQREEEE